MSSPLVLALFGPTGTGKTALACAIADSVPSHLISCDSMQLYRGLDVASAKPEGDERRHPWALVDWLAPEEPANLGLWVQAAEREVSEALERGLLPIVAGGTGLYLRGLLKGVAPAPPRDLEVRARLGALLERRGSAFLHRVLTRLDPPLAARLSINDAQRIVRGLEVRLTTGRPLSELQASQWRGPDRYRVVRIGLEMPRAELYRRLDARVAGFFERGLIEEVRALLFDRGVPPTANAFAGIGYAEVAAYLLGRGEARDTQELIALVQRNTRRYAKRQWTWFRRETPALWLDPRSGDTLARVLAELRPGATSPCEGTAGSDGLSL